MRARTPVLVLCALLLVVAACGGDDGDGDLALYAAALAESTDDGDGPDLTDDERDCLGDLAAEVIGIERLEEVGDPDDVLEATEDDLSVFDLSKGELRVVAEGYFDCAPGVRGQLIDTLAKGDEDLYDCLDDAFDQDDLIDLSATSIGGDDPDEAQTAVLTEAMGSCLDLGSDEGRDDYLEALAGALLLADGEEVGITGADAECIADRHLEVIGEERATAFGSAAAFADAVTGDYQAVELDPEEYLALAQAYGDCFPGVYDAFRAIVIETAELEGEAAACVAAVLTEDAVQRAVAATYAGESPEAALAAKQGDLIACAER